MGRTLGRAEFLAQRRERGRLLIIAIHVMQQSRQLGERRRVEAAVLLDAVARPRLELVRGPAGPGHADHWHIQMAAADHALERREDLLVRQVALGAEEDKGVAVKFAHGSLSFSKG